MHPIAIEAQKALTDDNLCPDTPEDTAVKRPSCCQRFNRCLQEKVYGSKYDSYRRGTATATGNAFRSAGLAHDLALMLPLRPGDILYRTHGDGGMGHVVAVGPDIIATIYENSVVHKNDSGNSYKGTRHLADVQGEMDTVARLPDLNAAPVWECVIGSKEIACLNIDNTNYIPAIAFANAEGFDCGWDDSQRQALVDGRLILSPEKLPTTPILQLSHAWYPVRDFAFTFGLSLEEDDKALKITIL